MPLGISYKPPGPPPPAASCYVCLEHSTDRKPLLRNCACRGDAGWAHVACLAEFAASKTTEARRENGPLINIAPCWDNCILCKTPHQQNVALAMAEASVKQYKHLPDTNDLHFFSLTYLARSRFDVDDHDGAFELYDRLLKMCDVLTSKGMEVRVREAQIYGMMGYFFFEKEQFQDALSIFERQRDLLVAIYGPNSPEGEEYTGMIVTLKEKIGIGGCGHQKRDTAAELVRARERFRENQGCGDTWQRLTVHSRLIDALREDGRHEEAMEQSEKLVADLRQSLGPDHPETLRYENHVAKNLSGMLPFEKLMASDASDVWAVIDCEQQPTISGQRVQILRATKEGARKYICLIKNDNGVSTKFKVTRNQFILETGTKVVVHGLVSSIDLNGAIGIIRLFDKEKRRYAVFVEEKKTNVLIKPINLNVVFC